MIDEKVKISIIVPIYKVEKYLRKCLQSLAIQTYSNIEIILVEDGSPDKCGQICDSFAQVCKNVIVLHQKNQGVSVARNNGINQANGDYILFVDPDDWIEQDCCEKLAVVVAEKKYDIVFFMDKEIDELTGNEKIQELGFDRELSKEDVRKIQHNNLGMNYRILGFHSGTPWGKLFRKDFVNEMKLRFTPGIVKAQDVLFDTQAYECLESAYYLSYVGYIYRKNEGSSNIRFNPQIVTGTYLLLEGLADIADKHKEDADFQIAMAHTCLNRINFIERLYLFNKNHPLKKKDIISVYTEYLNHPVVKKYLHLHKSYVPGSIGNRIRSLFFKETTLEIYYHLIYLRYFKK